MDLNKNECKFVVCVDPQTSIYYSINLETNQIHIEEFTDKQTQAFFKQKARIAIQQLRKIISWSRYGYKQSQNVWKFRRRRIKDYLLQNQKQILLSDQLQGQLPNSLTQQIKLNEFGQQIMYNKQDIQIQVNLRQYYQTIISKQLYNQGYKQIPKILRFNAKIFTSVNQIIKMISKMCDYQKHIQLVPLNTQNKFILKINGSEEYLYGNSQICNFRYIRKCIRFQCRAQLILSEKKLQDLQKYRQSVFERNREQIKRGYFKQINWQKLKNEQLILWYSPMILDKQEIKRIREKQKILLKLYQQKLKQQQIRTYNPFHLFNNKIQNYNIKLKLMKNKYQQPRFIVKQFSLEDLDNRIFQTQRKVLSIKNNHLIYSGQCQYRFQFKFINLTSLIPIFYLHRNFSKTYQLTQKSYNLLTSHLSYNNQAFLNVKKFNILKFVPFFCTIRILLTHGPIIITQFNTQKFTIANTMKFDQKFYFKTLSTIPLESKLFFQIKLISKDNVHNQIIGCCGCSVFDDKGFLKTGLIQINVWPWKQLDLQNAYYIQGYQRLLEGQKFYTKIMIELPKYNKKIKWSIRDTVILENLGFRLISNMDNTKFEKYYYKYETNQQIEQLLKCNSLQMLNYNDSQKQIIRKTKLKAPNQFKNLIFSLNWTIPGHFYLALQNRNKWNNIIPNSCLLMLSSKIVDQSIRLFATQKISTFTDEQLSLHVIQLVHCLSYDSLHQNSLIQLLFQKSLRNPLLIGHKLFWQLKSQLQRNFIFERYALYLQSLAMITSFRKLYLNEIRVNEIMMQLNGKVIQEIQIEAKNRYLLNAGINFLRKQLPDLFYVPINPKKINKDFIQIASKVLSSEGSPLLLGTTQNKRQNRKIKVKQPTNKPTSRLQLLNKSQRDRPGGSFREIIYQNDKIQQRFVFKCGYDFRQDQLIIQLFQIMDNIFLENGIDFRLMLQRVLPIGKNIGYVQVIENAHSKKKIITQAHNMGVPNTEAILYFLKKYSQSAQDFCTIKDNFKRSLAGYFIICYVLGIMQTQDSKIMISKRGFFFRISFQIFLGKGNNFSIKKSDVQFSTQYLSVFQGKQSKKFKQFLDLCAKGYNLIRKNSTIIIDLLILMIGNELSQLQNYQDIKYLMDRLQLNLNDLQARQKIKKQILGALQNQKKQQISDNIESKLRM